MQSVDAQIEAKQAILDDLAAIMKKTSESRSPVTSAT